MLKRMVRATLVTGIGCAFGAYAWSLAKHAAYGSFQDDEEELDEYAATWGEDEPNWAGDDDDDGEWQSHADVCPDCQAQMESLGEPGVLTAGKLRAIANWLIYSDSLLEELLEGLEDLPPSMTEQQLAYLQESLGNDAMATDAYMWADMLDAGADPTESR